jgi:hypothetical protein
VSRVTKSYLVEWIDRLILMGCDLSIRWAYGRPRVYNTDGSREVSPRLSTGEMALWLDGYEHGLTVRMQRAA